MCHKPQDAALFSLFDTLKIIFWYLEASSLRLYFTSYMSVYSFISSLFTLQPPFIGSSCSRLCPFIPNSVARENNNIKKCFCKKKSLKPKPSTLQYLRRCFSYGSSVEHRSLGSSHICSYPPCLATPQICLL